MENSIIKIKCPHCQMPLAFRKPGQGAGVSLTCPKCKNSLKVKISEKAIRLASKGEGRTLPARLFLISGPQMKQDVFQLREGNNIIGREDADTIQDIAIKGDATISRRSANIEVVLSNNGMYSYRISVLNAKNPIYVNGTPLQNGKSMSLNLGDILQFGNTKMVLKS
ncbi:MAG: FHA domain-containing protein [Bacteroidales bacterium]|nr:FHA domain-containing protein [Bacteroidales bacterium]